MRQTTTEAVEERAESGGYRRFTAPGGRRFAVNSSSMTLLSKVDAVVFDCDGVLIDARKSYDATIRLVVETMVEEIADVRLPLQRAAPRLISMIRRTGGFNSDWDTTYALSLFATVALDGRRDARGVTNTLMSIIAGFGSTPRGRGQEAVDAFLAKEFPQLRESLDRARRILGYPATPPEGRMTTLFDEVYFGAPHFKKMHGVSARNRRDKGLIESERTLITPASLKSLTSILGRGRMAIVTGRPFPGTDYSLGKEVMGYFDKGSSMFLGDADVDPALRPEYDSYRKPSPNALIRAKQRFSSKMTLYVGDSAEDLMMVKNVRRRGLEGFLFGGVYQTSPVQSDQASFFEREGSDLILETVNQVPSGLLLSRKSEVARK